MSRKPLRLCGLLLVSTLKIEASGRRMLRLSTVALHFSCFDRLNSSCGFAT